MFAAGAALLLPAIARAQDAPPPQTIVFAGGLLDDKSDLAYAGATFALPGASIGHGLALRGSVFGGDYNYQSGVQRIDGRFAGVELDALYQVSGDGLWVNFGPGVRYLDTTLSPNDPTNRRRGAKAEPALTMDGGKASGPWRADWYVSYGTQLDDYQARLSLTHHMAGPWRGGVEGAVEGDPTYTVRRIGPYVGYSLGANSELQMSGGVSDGAGRGEGAYLRLGVYRGF